MRIIQVWATAGPFEILFILVMLLGAWSWQSKEISEPINLGSGTGVRIKSIAETIAGWLGKKQAGT